MPVINGQKVDLSEFAALRRAIDPDKVNAAFDDGELTHGEIRSAFEFYSPDGELQLHDIVEAESWMTHGRFQSARAMLKGHGFDLYQEVTDFDQYSLVDRPCFGGLQCSLLVGKDRGDIFLVSSLFLFDRDFTLALYTPTLSERDRQQVAKDPAHVQNLPLALLKDQKTLEALVETNWRVMLYLPHDVVRDNRMLWQNAIANDWRAYCVAPPAVQGDVACAELAVGQNWRAIGWVPEKIQTDAMRELATLAVTADLRKIDALEATEQSLSGTWHETLLPERTYSIGVEQAWKTLLTFCKPREQSKRLVWKYQTATPAQKAFGRFFNDTHDMQYPQRLSWRGMVETTWNQKHWRNDPRPVLLYLSSKDDHSSATKCPEEIDRVMALGKYCVLYKEVWNVRDAIGIVKSKKKEGNIPVHTVWFNGHASAQGFDFNDHKRDTNLNSKNIAAFAQALVGQVTGQIIFGGCDTGKGGKDAMNLVNIFALFFPPSVQIVGVDDAVRCTETLSIAHNGHLRPQWSDANTYTQNGTATVQ